METEGRVALVTLKDENGDVIETGSSGSIDGNEDHSFVVGYDGQAYLENVREKHKLLIQQPTKGDCETQLVLGPVTGTRTTVEAICRSVQ
ncbi:hypothetical protein D3C80_1376410 [compost metagenome]